MLNVIRSKDLPTCVFSAIVVFILMETVGLGWFKAFIKTGNHQLYITSMLTILTIFLVFTFSKLKHKPVWVSAIAGLVFGYISGCIGIFILGIAQHGRSEIWAEWFNSFGAFGFGAFIVGSTVTGSWLVGAFLFLISRIIRFSPTNGSRGQTETPPV